MSGIAVGVVEDTIVSDSNDTLLRVVARCTVYSRDQIAEMCKKETLAILFRQARILEPVLSERELVEGGVVRRAPQAISEISKAGIEWMKTKLAL